MKYLWLVLLISSAVADSYRPYHKHVEALKLEGLSQVKEIELSSKTKLSEHGFEVEAWDRTFTLSDSGLEFELGPSEVIIGDDGVEFLFELNIYPEECSFLTRWLPVCQP